jgi:4'-phosphopantetheinyl transferase
LLGAADLHVWTVAIDGPPPPDAVRGADVCSADERARAARFVRPQDAAAFLAARGALRVVLARYVGTAPGALAFATGEWGKPALAGDHAACGVAFNLTHSGDVALIAVARDRMVGIDVERVRAMPEAVAIARRVLGDGVAAALQSPAGRARDHAFLRAWTVHEACIKALGRAIAVASAAVRIAVQNGDPVCAWADPAAAPHGLAVAPLATTPGHVAALAWTRGIPDELAPRIARFDYAGP